MMLALIYQDAGYAVYGVYIKVLAALPSRALLCVPTYAEDGLLLKSQPLLISWSEAGICTACTARLPSYLSPRGELLGRWVPQGLVGARWY